MKKFYRLLLSALLLISALVSNAATFIGNRTDFRDETIYFAMTTRFYDGDPTNNTYCWDGTLNVNDPEWRGDFQGLIDKLDYIKALGFTAVWISPVAENASGYDYHGYHAMDFSKIDHRYVKKTSTAADADVAFQTLIDEVHKRGMKIILDVVLQHTGNFGENHLCKMFEKDYSMNLGDISCMKVVPQSEGGMLPDNYASMKPANQYSSRLALMKNTDFTNHDIHNYWHHKAWFDWDDPSRWWGQIAGDCVDLNTEHPGVSNYIVECYSRFIKMGVDGFRIDTAGHIPRISFNNNFLPQFQEAAESAEAKSKRGDSPFFMFGEVCARSMEVIYRGANYNCSPCYYTWKETKDYNWDYNPDSWDDVVAIPTPTEGSQDYETVSGHINWESALMQGQDGLGHADNIIRRSDNALLNGNEYHTPDYTNFSGMSVIDFAMHWNFNSASGAFGVHTQDYLYNDATYNVVYVDSHDYAPDSNYRFNRDQATWAENLSLMFTFRGIPCIFYGSEVEFQKGKDIDKGTVIALKDSGRAYFGGYIEGSIDVMDFGEYNNATGNMLSSLTYPLARHIQRLNKIRAAVPALRKGQYSTEGCSGSLSFKRRYTDDTIDSYVLVTISGNSTFTNILNGTYVDAVTGDIKIVTDNTLTAECSGKGNMRVYVLNGPGQIGDDGKYLYRDSSVDQPWAAWPDETMPEDTWTVRPQSGQGDSGSREEPEIVTEPVLDADEQAVFLYHESWSNATAWIWKSSTNYTGGTWPGEKLQYLGNNMYKWTYTGTDIIPEGASIIFSNNGNEQSPGNNEGGYNYVNGGVYKIGTSRDPYEVIAASGLGVTITPRGGKFVGTKDVTITASNATSAWYKVGDGSEVPFSETATFTIGADMNVGETVSVSWSATNGTNTKTGSVEFTKVESLTTEWHLFFDNSLSNWSNVYCYIYGSNECNGIAGSWPGTSLTFNGEYYEYVVETEGALDECNVIFSNGGGIQTGNNVKVRNYGIYNMNGDTGETGSVINIPADDANVPMEYYNLQGIRIMEPATTGIYIVKKGNKVSKTYIRK